MSLRGPRDWLWRSGGGADISFLCTNAQRCGLIKGCQPWEGVGSGGGVDCCSGPEGLDGGGTEENINWGKVAKWMNQLGDGVVH